MVRLKPGLGSFGFIRSRNEATTSCSVAPDLAVLGQLFGGRGHVPPGKTIGRATQGL